MSVDSQFMEHRWGTRVELDAPVELRTSAGWWADASVKNASVSGAFVGTGAKLPLLSRVSVHLTGKAGEWLDACVVRVEDTGLALEWLDPGSDSVPALLSLRHDASAPGGDSHERAAYRDSVAWVSLDH